MSYTKHALDEAADLLGWDVADLTERLAEPDPDALSAYVSDLLARWTDDQITAADALASLGLHLAGRPVRSRERRALDDISRHVQDYQAGTVGTSAYGAIARIAVELDRAGVRR